ncbi:MAG: hypothetical protein OEV43_05730 [Coriobacteriia bacterium]|nr:hypothetical protein [Coriobacteriia bacterium]
MYQTDYILRMIEQVGTLLRRMLDALRVARPEEALQIADEAVLVVTDTPPELIDALGPEGVVQFFAAGGQLDLERAVLLAHVLHGRATAFEELGKDSKADAQREKADALLAAAREIDEDRVEALLDMLE